ncbi:MAG: long-chain-fatty-acid--CoA ligase [Okeania sp. SIO3B5]|uniref:long-chain-fatty-acid--CoA ligase n=1 Tax=Okeania sp. SIO3B5 TaxID=2607811 RepID=UPI0013FF0CBB|nr:long-chain-fatty-acid--CoA ligase [Okeania sp. SIO3B5]NEO53126.1 long-chain-fatty-acid--CoA ligase [Okeania sp. SIO3B5]
MIYDNDILTLADLSLVQGKKFSNNRALIFKDQSLTYSQLDLQSNRVANGLLAEGIKAQSRVALLAKDSLKSYEILFACAKINAVLVPINWRLVAAEVSYILRDADIEILFVGAEFYPLVQLIREEVKTIKAFIGLENTDQNWIDYSSWYQQYSDVKPDITVNPNDVAVQMYTSGTTGRPKGVQLGHYSFFAVAKEFAKRGENWINWSKNDKNLLILPSFHIGGLWWAIRGLVAGAENFILESFNAFEVLNAIEKHRITKMCMVPAMIQITLVEPECKQTDFSSLGHIIYGGSPIAESVLKEAMAIFSCDFGQIYGMTETGNCAVYLPADAHLSGRPKLLKSAGKAFPGVSLAVLGSEGQKLPPFEIGEVCINSPANMIGYWKLPEATAKTLVDGWIHTGDAGYFDQEGYIYVCDRIKDMICYGGENVYPAEVENILYEHPAIAEVAVIGIPDKFLGESIKAIVVLKAGEKTRTLDIINFARGKIADFKLPTSVDFVESLPRTPSGKVQKGKLRQKYWEGSR